MQPTQDCEPIVETRGDDWVWPLQFIGEDGNPVDLAGCIFDGAAVIWRGGELAITTENGRIAYDAASKTVTVTIARADASGVPRNEDARLSLPIVDTVGVRSTLVIIPLRIIVP